MRANGCFDTVHVVVPEAPANYPQDVVKLGVGCAIVVRSELVAPEGRGRRWKFRLPA